MRRYRVRLARGSPSINGFVANARTHCNTSLQIDLELRRGIVAAIPYISSEDGTRSGRDTIAPAASLPSARYRRLNLRPMPVTGTGRVGDGAAQGRPALRSAQDPRPKTQDPRPKTQDPALLVGRVVGVV